MCAMLLASVLLVPHFAVAADPEVIANVEGQPLAANVERLGKALEFLGAPLLEDVSKPLAQALKEKDVKKIQQLLDPHVLAVVALNPESRVKVQRGPATPTLQQAGYTPFIIKVVNDSTVKKPLRIASPQAGLVYSGTDVKKDFRDRFLHVEMFTAPPMTANLSGLKVEYAIALIYSREAGKREATIAFDVGQGTQDLGFRGEVPVLFDIKPGIPVKLSVQDFDGKPTVGPLHFQGRSRPRLSAARRSGWPPISSSSSRSTAHDGGMVLLPPGELTMTYGRGPEYKLHRAAGPDSRPRAKQDRRQARALDQPDGLRLLQRRPPHPRRRLCPLHQSRPKASSPRTCSCTSRARASTSAAT